MKLKNGICLLVVAGALSGCPSQPVEAPDDGGVGPNETSGPSAILSSKPYEPANNDCVHRGSGSDYPVGPGKKYASLGEVPFEKLVAGDTVRIYQRPEPYREKLMISGLGTAKDPIRICGVAGANGELPVIDGKDATTRKQLDFPYDGHQVRGLVIIGHPHDRPYEETPTHIVFEGIEVRNGSPPNNFTDRAGKKATYSDVVAGIFVERVKNLTIRGCIVTQNNNGIFIGTGGGVGLSQNILLEGNYIHDNGSLTRHYEHNVYNEASNVVYQFNRFGPPRIGANGQQGANIKERSAGVVIRHNYIEDGGHLIDLVDAQEAKDTTRPMASFHTTHVYGNVLIRGKTPSGSMVHYGGDSGVYADYRKGTLFFYNNTVVIKNGSYPDWSRTPIFEISTNEEKLDSRNNVYFTEKLPDSVHAVGLLGARDEISSGIASFAGDWISTGITSSDATEGKVLDVRAKVSGLEKQKRGNAPGFRDFAKDDYVLSGPSPVTPVPLSPEIAPELWPKAVYVKHQRGKARQPDPLLGAPLE
jgi:hypothetical protein